MSGNDAVIDIEAIEGLVSAIEKFERTFSATVDDAVSKVDACGGVWEDEDFQRLSLAMHALKMDVSSVHDIAAPLIDKAKQKIELVQALYKLQV